MMKALQAASAASLTSALDFGQSWNKWYYGLNYRVREGETDAASTQTIFSNDLDTAGSNTKEVKWQINLKSIVNEDTGESILILTHEFIGRVLYSDTFQFDVRFTTTTDTAQTVIDQDHVRCNMSNDVRNTAFWEVDAVDGYYPAGANADTQDDLVISDNNASLTNRGQDWFVEEDDLYRDDNLCTPPSGNESWG